MTAPTSPLARLESVLATMPRRIVACSGGMDSLVLASVAHTQAPGTTVVAHTRTAAVPAADTARVESMAAANGWDLRIVRSGELQDERYLANPVDRCYFCKSHLYDALDHLAESFPRTAGAPVIVSGANLDDLGEFRPGLRAAAEHAVRHPFVEAGLSKADVRELASALDLELAELPASPCLASRLYTGTSVTRSRLAAVSAGEVTLRRLTGIRVARCRIREGDVLVEVLEEDRARLRDDVLDDVFAVMRAEDPTLSSIAVDPAPYRPGRSFVGMPTGR